MMNNSEMHVWRHPRLDGTEGVEEMADVMSRACLKKAGFPEQGSLTEQVLGKRRDSPWMWNPDD